jgi:uncharacterized protein YukJ
VSIPRYGVLKARPLSVARGRTHAHIRAVADGVHFRVSVNVQSDLPPSVLRFIALRPFVHLMTDDLVELEPGFMPLASGSGGLALDYVREPLFQARSMRLLPADLPGPHNDLSDLIASLVARADAVYAFGSRWGPERKADRVFGFTPGNGVHNVHMNQGNHPRFRRDDGVWQDGALFLAASGEWVAVCLAFQSQTWHTDDRTGHPLTD